MAPLDKAIFKDLFKSVGFVESISWKSFVAGRDELSGEVN